MKMDYSKMPTTCSRIIIDGDPGAGKTKLAGKIALDLGFKVVSFDDNYLELPPGDGRPYIEKLNCEALRNKILASDKRIVIDGACALQVLATIGVRHDFHIFIKRYNGFLGWELGKYLGERTKPPHDKFWQEIVRYYKEYRPFDICDLCLSE